MLNTSPPAPVCLFAFNRPAHTARTLAALKANTGASETELYVFLDGPRNDDDTPLVDAVANIVGQHDGFAAVHLSRREQNVGLAPSIIDGITLVMQRYGRAIILEDDIVTSPAFLNYMNLALDTYADRPEVWHISGYNEPFSTADLPSGAALWRFMSCWGWASWADRWAHFDKDPQGLIKRFSADDIRRFNLEDAQDFWGQVTANARGEINTWAVFWYATIFERGGLCLSPHHSYTENIGLDGSGTHCDDTLQPLGRALNLDPEPPLPTDLEEDVLALERLRAHYLHKPSALEKLGRELRRMIKKIQSV